MNRLEPRAGAESSGGTFLNDVPLAALERILLGTILVIAVVGYIGLAWSLRDGRYAPAWSDEYHYLANARSFVETGRVYGTYLYAENVSRIGGFDFHGFSYHLLDAAVARIFGAREIDFIILNWIFLLLTVTVISRQRIPRNERLAIVVVILMYFVVPIYSFMGMQESMQVLFAVVTGFLLLRIYRVEEPARRRSWIFAYLAALVFASIFRPQWMLFTIGLVPLGRTRRGVAGYLALTGAAGLAAFVYSYLFIAPFEYGWFARVMVALHAGQALEAAGLVLWQFTVNLHDYFLSVMPVFWDVPGQATYPATVASQIATSYFISKYLVVILAAACYWRWLAARNRLALAVSLIVLLNTAMLFLTHDGSVWREHRTLALTFFFAVIALADLRPFRFIVPLLLLVLFPSVLNYTSLVIISRRQRVAQEYAQNPEVVSQFRAIADEIKDHRLTTVLFSREFYESDDFPGKQAGVPLLALPFRNAEGYPIRYTVNTMGEDFALFKPGFVDYVLAPEEPTPEDTAAGRSYRLTLERLEPDDDR
jgi:hypothetical protein